MNILNASSKGNRIYKALFKVLGLKDVIDISGEAETTGLGLMKVSIQ
jgi:hypothetical protein